MSSDSIDPPHSRLFVLCSKSITQEELKASFEKYGDIDDIWIVRDKNSGEPKGVVYIKFSKTSSAALAAEEMHGKVIDSTQKPIKVMVAHNREQGAKKEDDTERLVRLFIVVNKTATEEEIRSTFEEYGKVESVNVVKNRETGENKGFAYVKFVKPYTAALAFEECPKSYKAVFARPREQKQSHSVYENPYDRMSGPNAPSGFSYSSGGGGWGNSGGMEPSENYRIVALVPVMLRESQVFRLFDLIPGLQFCRPLQEPRNYQQFHRIVVQYSSQQAVQHALEKLNGFEYPPGHRISVKPAMGADCHINLSGPKPGPREGGGPGVTTISNSELATLTSALAKAESIIKAAGLTQGSPRMGHDQNDSNYCSVTLPPPKPLAKIGEPPAERLFIVCQPGLPPMYALRDVFGRFGDMTDLYVINGKNCGYVSYASKESAQEAIDTLHQQEVCGMRLKVMKAEPPRTGPNDRKRIRIDTEVDN